MASFQAEFSDHSDREEELEDMLTSTTNEDQIQKRVLTMKMKKPQSFRKKYLPKIQVFSRSRNTLSFSRYQWCYI
jgi:hypothetical protein